MGDIYIDEGLRNYIKDMKQISYPEISYEEEMNLIKRAQNGDAAAREEVITRNLRLVFSVAKRYVGRMPYEDLIQEGNMGLMYSIDKFDTTINIRFSTYASHWIRQYISRSIENKKNTIRIPAHMLEKQSKIKRAEETLFQEFGRKPSNQEVAEYSNYTIEEVDNIMSSSNVSVLSFDASIKDDGDGDEDSYAMLIEDSENNRPEYIFQQKDERETIYKVLDTLSEREAEVISYRFGLKENKIYNLEEIGEKLNITKERARQLEKKALIKLRSPFRANILRTVDRGVFA